MNKNEFIQEAALRLLSGRPDMPLHAVCDAARTLADNVYSDVPWQRTAVDGEPVETLLRQVDIYEKAYFATRDHATGRQGSGFSVRLSKAFAERGITTVGGLLKMGRREFLKSHGVGHAIISAVDDSLHDLFCIDNW